MNSLHTPLSNPTINSTVLIDKIPQQNKTDRAIFVQPGKTVSTSVMFFYPQQLVKGSKHGFLFCFVLLSPKKTQALDCLISSLFLYLKLRKMTSGNLWLCVSAKPTKSGAHLSHHYVHQTNQIVTFLFVSSKICSCVIISRSRKSTALFTMSKYTNLCKGQKKGNQLAQTNVPTTNNLTVF